MSSYLIKFDNEKNRLDIERVMLREKLGTLSTILIVVGSLLYMAQNLYAFNFDFVLLITLLLSATVLYFSINVGIKLFLIKDDLYQKTKEFDEQMRKDQINLNESLEDL